ncbi:MAG: acyl-CoA dehydrogenase family protein [Terricaulis sp.]
MSAQMKIETPPTDWSALAQSIAAEIALEAARHDAEESFVAGNYRRLKDAGLFKALVPAEFGGGGAEVTDICNVIRILGAACGSTALAFSMHSHLVAAAAWRWRHQNAPTDGLLKRVAAENLVLVSSGGSDWLKSAGSATKVDGGFRINARKIFSSGSPAGDLLMTSAVYDDPEAGPTVLHFGVSLKAEGVTLLDTWHVMGMRGTGSHDIDLKDVFVADAAVAGRRAQGKWHMLFHVISKIAFPIILSAYVGVAEGARAKAVEIARKKPADEALTLMVGEMENALAAATMALEEMIYLAETAAPGPETTNRVAIARHLVRTSGDRMRGARDGGRGRSVVLQQHRPRARVSRCARRALSSAAGKSAAALLWPSRAWARHRWLARLDSVTVTKAPVPVAGTLAMRFVRASCNQRCARRL